MMNKQQYFIAYNTIEPSPDPNVMSEIARVFDTTSEKQIASIVYCKNIFKRNGQHTSIQKDGAFFPFEIQLDDVHCSLINSNKSLFEVMIMHEVGHLVNNDFERTVDGKEAMNNRSFMIAHNQVAEEELLADRFAVIQCGKNAVNRMLDYLIQSRKQRGYGSNDPGIIEIQLRKNAVKRI